MKDHPEAIAAAQKKTRRYVKSCRAFQAVMAVGQNFMGYRMPECFAGAGAIRELAPFLVKKGAKRVFVVTGRHIYANGLPQGMLDAMAAAGIAYTVFTDLAPNPTSDDVEAGLAKYRAAGCDSIVAFGGGAPMDCAKAIAARIARPGKSVAKLQGVLKVRRRIPLFVAVPTTAGTGSETTVAAVITDSKTHRKASINDPSILPKYAVLDPELTVGMSPEVTAMTGLDALCHAVEAYTNARYNTEEEDRLAVEAVRLIHGNLLTAYRDGSNLAARQAMQQAAFYAGRAFTRGCVGYVHAIGHTLGGLYGVPHGLAMGILLPHVMRAYGISVLSRLANLADACGMGGELEVEKMARFLCWIEWLKREMNIPEKLDMVRDEDIPQMAEWAVREANPLYPVPSVWTKEEMMAFIGRVRV